MSDDRRRDYMRRLCEADQLLEMFAAVVPDTQAAPAKYVNKAITSAVDDPDALLRADATTRGTVARLAALGWIVAMNHADAKFFRDEDDA